MFWKEFKNIWRRAKRDWSGNLILPIKMSLPLPIQERGDLKLTCRDCKYAIFHDYGYSNWTVEGTEMYCAENAHPKEKIEVTFNDDKDLQFALDCGRFCHGDAIDMDVDEERVADLTEDQKAVWGKYRNV